MQRETDKKNGENGQLNLTFNMISFFLLKYWSNQAYPYSNKYKGTLQNQMPKVW
jgi:hypothetical protein